MRLRFEKNSCITMMVRGTSIYLDNIPYYHRPAVVGCRCKCCQSTIQSVWMPDIDAVNELSDGLCSECIVKLVNERLPVGVRLEND